MVLLTKSLHEGQFTWALIRDGVVHLSATQLAMLVDGLGWTRVSSKPKAAGRCWVRGEDFAAACRARMNGLIMTPCPDPLPTDPAV
ncbi:IS66 family insertion sequence element accessory protein TnpB [Bradyrhizobium tropiciagri]|uniref:IS66 family insertion sequence element accessory protein TnpB n=1 Tax=Bradyrhizobium tropiciagri TaxID=312253 RepID=UPI003D310F4E